MRSFAVILALVFTSALSAEITSWVSPKELSEWEKTALEEVEKHKNKSPEKEFLLYMIAGRELFAHGLSEKAQEYYLKAFEHPSKSDKSEAVIQLVSLSLKDKAALSLALVRANKWFTQNPDKKTTQIERWLKMLKGSLNEDTPTRDLGYFTSWATDAHVDELLKKG